VRTNHFSSEWHEPDQRGRSVDIRCSRQTGSDRQRVKPTRLTLRRHLPVIRRRFALSTFTLPSEGSDHLFAGVDRADLLRGSNGELVALQFEEPDLGRASQNLVPR
jgi:hypothetical protein